MTLPHSETEDGKAGEIPEWVELWGSVRKAINRLDSLTIDRRDATVADARQYVMDAFEQLRTAYESCDRQLKSLRAVPSEGSQEREWQPIETAPKDGTNILACIPGFTPAQVQWNDAYGRQGWGCDPETFCNDKHFREYWESTRYDPTHWMPLPPPPSPQAPEAP